MEEAPSDGIPTVLARVFIISGDIGISVMLLQKN
jgi:hypothetical protein